MTPSYYLVKKNQPYDFNSLWDHLGFGAETGKTFTLATDIIEEKDKFVLRMDAPGVKEEDFKIEFSEGHLNISGERRSTLTDNKEEAGQPVYTLKETSYGKFSRSFRLNDSVNGEAISATLKDGILSIEIPKMPEKKAKVISVNKLS